MNYDYIRIECIEYKYVDVILIANVKLV